MLTMGVVESYFVCAALAPFVVVALVNGLDACLAERRSQQAQAVRPMV